MMSRSYFATNSRLMATAAVFVAGFSIFLFVAAGSADGSSGSFGVERWEIQIQEEDHEPAVQAGSHPYSAEFTFLFNRHPFNAEEEPSTAQPGEEVPNGDVRDLRTTLPAGMIVNLLSVERCSEEELAQEKCPPGSRVGVVKFHSGRPEISGLPPAAVYNVAPSSSNVPGEVGFSVAGFFIVVHVIGSVHAGNYALAAEVPGIPQVTVLDGATLTLFGRVDGRPFLTMPTSCGEALTGSVEANSWQEPAWTSPVQSSPSPAMTGCQRLSFTPSIELKPETAIADTPTGVSVDLEFPQIETLGSLAEANLKEAVVTLPPGLVISPSTVGGLGACSEAQIQFASSAQPTCPESSKIASVEATTPLLRNKLSGSVYLAQQGNAGVAQGSNPFKALIAIYLVVEGSGIRIKVPGEVSLNQSTGQVTARFGKNPLTGFYLPQVPYSVKLNFFGGPRAPLVPTVCGSYTTTSLLTPWSAPQSGPPATPQSTFEVDSGCPTGAFNPALTAGTTSNQAGGYSPFVATFTRQDGEQELGAIQVRMPPGLLAMLSHVPLCGEPQAQKGECGSESQIGTVSAVVGPGTEPFSVTGGRAYLTGPYKGAPFGLAFVVPAKGGPFDLGDVIVRAAISIDPTTEAVTITSDPLPTVLQGVPLQMRSVTVEVNRPEFIFNPTSCAKMAISATLQGSLGAKPQESVPFQAGDCAALSFRPKLAVATSGKTSKARGASLDAKLVYPTGSQGSEANIRSVKVELPRQLPARLATLQKACLAVTFEVNPADCPAASVVGIARVLTPLLPVTLTGPVYFVSHGGEAFPSLIVVLQGDGVRADVVASTFISKRGITTSTFRNAPDVPFSSFELYLPQGEYSALAANGDLCKSKLAMPTVFTAQNGTVLKQSTKISITGCPVAKTAKLAKKRRAARGVSR
jgi:hypothetical protein